MNKTNFFKIDSPIRLVPSPIQRLLGIGTGGGVGPAVGDERMVVKPRTRPHYTLDELLAQCDTSTELTEEEREWLDAKPAGREII